MRSRGAGFTLSEMLLVLGICSLLLALAAPGFARQRATAAVRAASLQAFAAVHLARRLALAQGRSVTVCPTSNGSNCVLDGTEWLLFANDPAGSDARLDASETVLRRWNAPAGVQVTGTRGYAAFQPRPGAAATVTFEFRHPGAPGMWRGVVVSQTGRPRLEGAD